MYLRNCCRVAENLVKLWSTLMGRTGSDEMKSITKGIPKGGMECVVPFPLSFSHSYFKGKTMFFI